MILTSCASAGLGDVQNIDETIGVAAGENAALCIHASIDPAFNESGINFDRVEGPELTRLKDLTPEQIEAMAMLTPEQIEALNTGVVIPDCT
jgi:hypothetical protein